jgi:thiol-disulfide isomerase/thioredoxin
MPDDENEKPKSHTRNVKVFGVAMVLIGVGVIAYLLLGGLDSGGQDDDVSLTMIDDKRAEETVVLYFWGDGCIPCQQQKPIIKEIEDNYENMNVTFYWIKYDNHKDLTDHYDVTAIPTTIILNQAGRVETFVGLTERDTLSSTINNAIDSYDI